MSANDTSDGRAGFGVTRVNHTTAEIEMNWFSGGNPDPFYFIMREPPTELAPITLAVLDGELRVIRDESPPGARLPNFNSALFKLAETPVPADQAQ